MALPSDHLHHPTKRVLVYRSMACRPAASNAEAAGACRLSVHGAVECGLQTGRSHDGTISLVLVLAGIYPLVATRHHLRMVSDTSRLRTAAEHVSSAMTFTCPRRSLAMQP